MPRSKKILQNRWYLFVVKVVFDLLFSVIMILVLLPVFAILWLLTGASYFWLVNRGILQRKISAIILYGMALLITTLSLALMFSPIHNSAIFWGLYLSTIVLLALSARSGRIWLPAFAKTNDDEIKISKAITSTYRNRRIFIATLLFIIYFALALFAS